MSLAFFSFTIFLLVILVGALPFSARFANRPALLRRMTAIAGGFLISAALIIAMPEGFELYLHADAQDEAHVELHGQDVLELDDHEHESEHGEVRDHSEAGESEPGLTASFIAGLAVLSGFIFLLLLEGFGFGHDVHEEHHDHAQDHGHDHVNHPGASRNVVIGLSLHSIMDGLAVGAAFALGEIVLSLQLALVVLMHKFPAAFSLSAYSLHERNSTKKSMMDLVLFALTTPVAMILAVQFLSSIDDAVVGLLLLFSAGSFIYVATVDVLPNIHIQGQSRETLWLVLAGIVSMTMISLVVGMLMPELHHAH